MKHYYLFNNASRATQYGIGTYLNQLSHGLKEEAKVSIISINSDKEEVKSTEDNGIRTIHIPKISYVENLEEAVRLAAECAEPGDAVLLSPACASWGMFPNYEVRGRMFKDLVRAL